MTRSRSLAGSILVELGVAVAPRRRARSPAALIVASLVVAMVPLVFIVGYVVAEGWAAVTSTGWFTDDIPIVDPLRGPGDGPGGRRHAPDHRRGRRRWRSRSACSAASTSTSTAPAAAFGRLVRFLAEVMTGVPSIVMGLFIYTSGC